MLQLINLIPFVILYGFAEGRKYSNIISVSNGGKEGIWGPVEFCREGLYAYAFSIKIDQTVRGKDNTAVNGIRLFCNGPGRPIQSSVGSFGKWQPLMSVCTRSCYLTSFAMKVQSPQGRLDDTAINSVIFKCCYSNQLLRKGGIYGNWGEWSTSCTRGICGIQTRVQPDQGKLDDTSLNDVRFYCCSN